MHPVTRQIFSQHCDSHLAVFIAETLSNDSFQKVVWKNFNLKKKRSTTTICQFSCPEGQLAKVQILKKEKNDPQQFPKKILLVTFVQWEVVFEGVLGLDNTTPPHGPRNAP